MPEDFAKDLHTTIDDPEILHQIHLMIDCEFIEPMGSDNWDFLSEVSNGLIN